MPNLYIFLQQYKVSFVYNLLGPTATVTILAAFSSSNASEFRISGKSSIISLYRSTALSRNGSPLLYTHNCKASLGFWLYSFIKIIGKLQFGCRLYFMIVQM